MTGLGWSVLRKFLRDFLGPGENPDLGFSETPKCGPKEVMVGSERFIFEPKEANFTLWPKQLNPNIEKYNKTY